jgi:osmoprotectant transport system permease protein
VGAPAEGDGVILADAFRPHTFVDAFRFMGDHPGLMWDKTLHHLEISALAIGIALALAIPLGVVLGHYHRGSFAVINASNVLRALPSLAAIAIGLGFFGLGLKNVTFALVVLGAPPMLTNAYVAVDGVSRELIEAARGMGMRPRLAAFVGGGGLGDIIVNQASYGLAGVIAGSLVVTVLAFATDFAFAGLQRLVTPRPLRGRIPLIEPDVQTPVFAGAEVA